MRVIIRFIKIAVVLSLDSEFVNLVDKLDGEGSVGDSWNTESFWEKTESVFAEYVRANQVPNGSIETKKQLWVHADWMDDRVGWSSHNPAPIRVFLSAWFCHVGASFHEQCIHDFKVKSQYETRCSQLLYKIALQRLQTIDRFDLGQRLFNHIKSFDKLVDGSTMVPYIGWQNQNQTPTIWIDGLSTQPYWDCDDERYPMFASLNRHLRKNYEVMRDEIKSSLNGRLDSVLKPAYPFLHAKGVWRELVLYRAREWNQTVCTELVPQICRILKEAPYPSRPDIPYAMKNNEEAMIFFADPGAHVTWHVGAVNSQINVHLGLMGVEGSTLRCNGEDRTWELGGSLCFDDSYGHQVYHSTDAPERRVVLGLRVMHPSMTIEHYKGETRFDAGSLEDQMEMYNMLVAEEL